jgi:outer membrane biosynthesis protein TonB
MSREKPSPGSVLGYPVPMALFRHQGFLAHQAASPSQEKAPPQIVEFFHASCVHVPAATLLQVAKDREAQENIDKDLTELEQDEKDQAEKDQAEQEQAEKEQAQKEQAEQELQDQVVEKIPEEEQAEQQQDQAEKEQAEQQQHAHAEAHTESNSNAYIVDWDVGESWTWFPGVRGGKARWRKRPGLVWSPDVRFPIRRARKLCGL